MKLSEKITIFLGIVLVAVFVIGLAWSISTGLAGFWKGLPFWIIVIFCLYLLIIDSLRSMEIILLSPHQRLYLLIADSYFVKIFANISNMKKLLAIIGFGLILFGAFQGIIHLLSGNVNDAKAASGDFLFLGLILTVIWFIWHLLSPNEYSKVSKSERIKDIPTMTKEEYINMYNVGTDISKFHLGKEWEKEKKIIK